MYIVPLFNQFREDMPKWLKNYKPGDYVSFSDFISERIGYYPGSGFDGNLVSVANRAHCLHSYIYVDYGVTREQLTDCIRWDGFRGHHPIGTVEWTEQDLTPHGQYPLDEDYKAHNDPMGFVLKDVKPYCFLEIFERDPARDDDWGAERFAVAFLFADGITTGIRPKFIICATNTRIFDGYDEVPGVQPTFGGMHNHERHLYSNLNNGI